MHNTALITARQLSKVVPIHNGTLTILDKVDLEINRGDSVAILGASGSGKSTLLGLLAGLDVPSGGEVWVDDACISRLDEDGRARVRAGRIGFVFQSFQLLPSLTAVENVMLPLELAGQRDAAERARDWLARVGLADRLDHYPRQLSGGEQQRVAIARAFAARPALLFADEPTGNLDSATGTRIIELLFELNRDQRTTLVLVTHDPSLAERCGRHVQLDAGRATEPPR
jgi:putative ABC transport system ATP-binding protein